MSTHNLLHLLNELEKKDQVRGNITLQNLLATSGLLNLMHRGSYMSALVLLNLSNELGKRDKMRGLPSILSLFATSLINSIIQEHEC